MFVITSHTVPKLEESIRLYDYAFEIFHKYIPSKKGIKKALKRGEIWVDEKQGKSGDWVKENQKIELRDLELNPPKPYPLAFEIVYEDDYLAVINKPAGISVSGNQYRTIQNAIINQVNNSTQPDTLKWPRPVHRLDNQTSGLLVIAKTISAIKELSRQFELKEIQKEYHSIVVSDVQKKGIINSPIQNQQALTEFELVKSVKSIKNGDLSLLKLKPKTGRTHQLRIHCANSGFPILGDKLYGEKGNTLLHKGLFLCSTKITFNHPINKDVVEIEIPLPHKFEYRIKKELEMSNKLV